MADIDNMRGDTLRVVEENTLDNMRGVTQRVISENSIDNTRGVTYRVYNVNPAPAPVIDELNVTPSTSAQTITAPEGTDGYSPVNVSAVDSTIDANIVAGNIKKDVTILGVTGSYEGSFTPTAHVTLKKDANNALYLSTPIDLTGVTDISNDVFNKYNGFILSNAVGAIFINAESLTTVSGANAFYNTFANYNGITEFNLPNLTTVSGTQSFADCCNGCTGLTTFNLPSLTTISGTTALQTCCKNCTNLTNVNLSSLTTISSINGLRAAFLGCKKLVSVDLSSLQTISGTDGLRNAFGDCVKLTSVDLSSLANITGQTCLKYLFENCTLFKNLSFPALKSTSFGSYTDQFDNMLSGCTGVTVHFPSNLQSVIGSWTSVTNGFSGTNTTVLFDLPATE